MEISRILINNGWTIENRRLLASKTSGKNSELIIKKFRTLLKECDKAVVSPDSFKLNRLDKDSLLLTMKVGKDKTYAMKDEKITFDNIAETLFSFFNSINEGKVNFDQSKTMERLYSPEFAVKKCKTQDGYYVTTVINRFKNQPEEVFIRRENKYSIKNSQGHDNDVEHWMIYRKNPITRGYERIGWKEFEIDSTQRCIMPGYMEREKGNAKYEGIGIRLHQVAIERMIQENFDNVCITSTSEAFPFHYKCGFRITKPVKVSKDIADFKFLEWGKLLGIPPEELKESLVLESFSNDMEYCIDNNKLQEIKKELIIRTGNKYDTGEINMRLDEENMLEWKKRIKSQPIIL